MIPTCKKVRAFEQSGEGRRRAQFDAQVPARSIRRAAHEIALLLGERRPRRRYLLSSIPSSYLRTNISDFSAHLAALREMTLSFAELFETATSTLTRISNVLKRVRAHVRR